MATKLQTRPDTDCLHCAGTGHEIDNAATGRVLARMREDKGLKQAEVGERMGLSHTYVSDLELGKRNWSSKLFTAYLKALQQAPRSKE